jgi:hypothetical protein
MGEPARSRLRPDGHDNNVGARCDVRSRQKHDRYDTTVPRQGGPAGCLNARITKIPIRFGDPVMTGRLRLARLRQRLHEAGTQDRVYPRCSDATSPIRTCDEPRLAVVLKRHPTSSRRATLSPLRARRQIAALFEFLVGHDVLLAVEAGVVWLPLAQQRFRSGRSGGASTNQESEALTPPL